MGKDPNKRILVEGLWVKECIGCGACCRASVCYMGLVKGGDVKRNCPYIRYHDERWWCGIVEDAPEPEKSKLIEHMYIGKGCCQGLFNGDRAKIPTPEEVKEREKRGYG
ncbi:MAG: hypothetical protein WC824_10035 [Bacteroidota bacterium]|jgi:hypothetical protein